MAIIKINFCLLMASIFSFSPAYAQDGPISLQEALQIAVDTHPSVAAKKNELIGSENGLDASKWQRFPGISAQSTAGQVSNSAVSTVRLEQPLWTGGRITADIDAATAKVNASEAAVNESEQAILIKTASAFSEIIRLQARISAADESIDEHQRLLDLIQRRADSQISPKSEAIMARARLAQAKSERIQLWTLATNAKADLEQIVGLRSSQLLVPKVNLMPSAPLDDMINAALTYSPQMHRLIAETKTSEAEIQSKKAVLWPQLSARYEHLWGGAATNDIAYLAVSYQPGAGLSALSSIKEAESKRNASESSRESIKKDIVDKIRTDWNQMQASQSEAEVLAELVESTRGVYESFVRQYAAGRKTWVEVLNARREATQARYSLADAQWNGFIAGVRMDIATGKVAANTLRLEVKPN